MKQLWKRIKREDGAAQMIEAAIIYPVVFLCIFVLIYIGLYILQSITVSTYAQKAVMLASREISYPGYLEMVKGQESVYSDASVEGNEKLLTSLILNNNPKGVDAQTYRYWRQDFNKKDGIEDDKLIGKEIKHKYEDILKEMVVNHSILTSKEKDEIEVVITTKNNIIVQYVNVTVSQPLMGFPVLDFFGIETPVVSATAQTTVGDTDELIRNVDFVTDALAAFANKLGLDIGAIKEKMNGILDFFKVNKE